MGHAGGHRALHGPGFPNNILLTRTERLTMTSRPKEPKYARNKNILRHRRFRLRQDAVFRQAPTCCQMLIPPMCVRRTPQGRRCLRGQVGRPAGKTQAIPYQSPQHHQLFKKSMKYNPAGVYPQREGHSETGERPHCQHQGRGRRSAPKIFGSRPSGFYTAPSSATSGMRRRAGGAQLASPCWTLSTASEAREDDEEFQNPGGSACLPSWKSSKPDHFAVKQYNKYKLASRRCML